MTPQIWLKIGVRARISLHSSQKFLLAVFWKRVSIQETQISIPKLSLFLSYDEHPYRYTFLLGTIKCNI